MEERLDIELLSARPKALAIARRFLQFSGLEEDPEDIVQDVLVRLWEARREGSSIRNLDAWVTTTTKNCCVGAWRKARGKSFLPLPDNLLSEETSSRRIDEKEADLIAAKALDSLSPGTRLLLRLKAKGLSLDEISAVTGRPKGSIKSSISGARKELVNKLK